MSYLRTNQLVYRRCEAVVLRQLRNLSPGPCTLRAEGSFHLQETGAPEKVMAGNRSFETENSAVGNEIFKRMKKRRYVKTAKKASNSNQGERHLAVSIMMQALKDAKEDPNHHRCKNKQTESEIHRNDALHWLLDDKEWGFKFWSAILGLNPQAMREQILKQLNGDIESPKPFHHATAAFR